MTTCAWCGAEFMLDQAGIKKSNNNFCRGKDCYRQWHSANTKGTDHPNWKGRVALKCATCGRTVVKRPSEASHNVFCRRECFYTFLSKTTNGASSRHWRGGMKKEREWWLTYDGGRKWRTACKQLDEYTCQICNTKFSRHTKGLNVHHCLSFASYPEYRSLIENGTTVCSQCHGWLHSNDGKSKLDELATKAVAASQTEISCTRATHAVSQIKAPLQHTLL